MEIGLFDNGHNFEKRNLMTLEDGKGTYDLYVCTKCGLQGKRRGVRNELEIRTNKMYCSSKPEQGNIQIKALCENDHTSFVDTFYVKSEETAEQEIKAMINWFNSTLRPYEKPRRFVKIVKDK